MCFPVISLGRCDIPAGCGVSYVRDTGDQILQLYAPATIWKIPCGIPRLYALKITLPFCCQKVFSVWGIKANFGPFLILAWLFTKSTNVGKMGKEYDAVVYNWNPMTATSLVVWFCARWWTPRGVSRKASSWRSPSSLEDCCFIRRSLNSLFGGFVLNCWKDVVSIIYEEMKCSSSLFHIILRPLSGWFKWTDLIILACSTDSLPSHITRRWFSLLSVKSKKLWKERLKAL